MHAVVPARARPPASRSCTPAGRRLGEKDFGGEAEKDGGEGSITTTARGTTLARRLATIAVGVLLTIPLSAASANAAGPCKPDGGNCARPVWCDGTGYSCDAVGLVGYLTGL